MPFFQKYPLGLNKEPSILTSKNIVSWKKSQNRYNFDILPKSVILTPSTTYLSKFKQIFKKKLKGISGDNFVLNSSYLLSSGFGNGAPAIVSHLEELKALGAEKFIFIGFAGIINANITEGKAFLINAAYSYTGVSCFYSENTFFNPKNLFAAHLNSTLQLPEKSCLSVDAPYRETKTLIAEYQQKKISLIDMETAAIFAFSEFYQIPIACILIAADNLTNSIWHPPKDMYYLKNTLHTLIKKISNR